MDNIEALKANLLAMELPIEAIDWLVSFYEVIQSFDDVKDEQNINDKELYQLIFNSMVKMPANQFFLQNSAGLAHSVNLVILKWIASNALEQNKRANAKSFVWRAGFFDVVLQAVFICKGFNYAKDNAHTILSLYGESLEDYLKEFNNA